MRSLMAAAAACLVLAGCGGPPAATDATAPAQGAAVVPTADHAGLVARVNGVGISRLTFEAELRRRSTVEVADAEALAQQVLDGLIERELVRQAARAQNITVTLDEARQEVERLKATLPSAADWEAYLQLNNLTEPQMVAAMMEQLTTTRVRDVLYAPLYGNVPQANARHILVATEAQAAALLAQLQNNADFVTLAQQHSIDNATRDTGGELGWFTAQELIDTRLTEVIFSLQPGAIAGPIPSRVGYHIVQLVALEERPIEPERLGVLMDALYREWLSGQIAASTIERYR